MKYLSPEEGFSVNVSYGKNLIHSSQMKGNLFNFWLFNKPLPYYNFNIKKWIVYNQVVKLFCMYLAVARDFIAKDLFMAFPSE